MFRISKYLRELQHPTPLTPPRKPAGPVVIWNLIRRCNLTCKHCYSISANKNFPDELSTEQVFTVMDDLKAFGVPVLILSGGEPLLRPDIFEISHRAKHMGFYVGLSTNGTLINKDNIKDIAAVGYNYVGISIDGMRETHDRFRRMQGGFDAALNGIRLCRDSGAKVGMRFTMMKDNAHELPQILQLMEEEEIHKFYFSHLNYAGRGNIHRKDDAIFNTTRSALELLFDKCWHYLKLGHQKEFVTGNNDADAIYMLNWVKRLFPGKYRHIQAKLSQWGGNSSGVNIANIDNKGNVHPDTMWWDYNLGSVKERPFSQIWQDTSDPLMAGLKMLKRPVEGRCRQCRYLNICNGNTRVRAYQLSGDFWAEDPGCYLSDEEIGVSSIGERLLNSPYVPRRKRHIGLG